MRVEADFEYLGLRCVVVKFRRGFRCGYVGISDKTHPFYNLHTYHQLPAYKHVKWKKNAISTIGVHGGISYDQFSTTHPIATQKPVKWFGFDCNHSGDILDTTEMTGPELNDYEAQQALRMRIRMRTCVCDLEFCIKECKELAWQIVLFSG